jgi:hypothetical protein
MAPARMVQALGEARFLENLIGPAFRQADRPPKPSPPRAENLQQGPRGRSVCAGSLNLSQTSTSFPHGPAAAPATWRVIRDAHSTPRQRWEGTRYGLALTARPAWRR